MKYENTLDFARELDNQDPLAAFRDRFHIPKVNGKEVIYFTGNSLGLLPKKASEFVEQEFADWRSMGVKGHMNAKNPWFRYHNLVKEPLSRIVGAKPMEVIAMNSLTVNLNLLMISFYQPGVNRNKIIVENNPFPSDYYAVEQQIRFHGNDPGECLIELKPARGEYNLTTDRILKTIKKYKNEVALVLFSGVNYYSGQFYDIEKITNAAHDAGAFAGFDLAHAAGNIPLKLNKWGVDFAAWCSYKYLNSGPGGVGGAFVHERHGRNAELPRLAGWWGNDENTRFSFPKHFEPAAGVDGWQMSNAQVFPLAVHRASLEIFDEAGMENLRDKSLKLTGYLEFILKDIWKKSNLNYTVVTPKEAERRGCQLSILTAGNGQDLYSRIQEGGVFADWREPNVIRVAPVPLYNTFEDVFIFGQIIESAGKKPLIHDK